MVSSQVSFARVTIATLSNSKPYQSQILYACYSNAPVDCPPLTLVYFLFDEGDRIIELWDLAQGHLTRSPQNWTRLILGYTIVSHKASFFAEWVTVVMLKGAPGDGAEKNWLAQWPLAGMRHPLWPQF